MLRVRFRRAPGDPAGVLVWPVAAGDRLPEGTGGAAEAGGFTAAAGTLQDVADPPRGVLLGLGRPTRRLDWERAGAAAALHLAETPAVTVAAEGLAPAEAAGLAAGLALGAWRFDEHRTREPTQALARATLLVADPEAADAAWQSASAAIAGCLLARELVAQPASHLTTIGFATRLRELAGFGLQVEVWGRKRMAQAGMGALLAVGRASASPPRLVTLRWRGSTGARPLALVGKGLVFDTGGISIKPAGGMAAMRADMAGAAACAGAMLALALRRSPAPAVAVLPIAENATGAAAYRPGDVLHMASGSTVEVVDTDAEGRLVLADALHHAIVAHRPRAVIDLATLTGAIVRALGHHRAGLFGSDAPLLAALAAAGEEVGEGLWPMPIGTRHRDELGSDIADLRQCVPSGGGAPGWAARFVPDACHAAAFLREFTGSVPWAHLDIAGVDTQAEPHALGPAGPTGFGVRLLDRLVAARFEEPEAPHP